jgi:hypothetical protein
VPKSAIRLRSQLLGEFGNGFLDISIVAPPRGKIGCFEVSVGGHLVHSKLSMGHGKAESDEELDRLIEHVQRQLDARQQPKQHMGHSKLPQQQTSQCETNESDGLNKRTASNSRGAPGLHAGERSRLT